MFETTLSLVYCNSLIILPGQNKVKEMSRSENLINNKIILINNCLKRFSADGIPPDAVKIYY